MPPNKVKTHVPKKTPNQETFINQYQILKYILIDRGNFPCLVTGEMGIFFLRY